MGNNTKARGVPAYNTPEGGCFKALIVFPESVCPYALTLMEQYQARIDIIILSVDLVAVEAFPCSRQLPSS